MKISKAVLSLMLALAAGSAAAAGSPVSAGTTAGISIVNQASASFTDPTTGTAATPVTSNAVTTTVNPITGFDIVYSDSSVDDTSATAPAASYDKANVVPGGTLITKYTVLNNSNINGYVITLTPNTTGSATALPNTAPVGGAGGVQYFADDGTGTPTGAALTSVTLNNGAQQNIVQVITIPDAAIAGQRYSASPQGTAQAVTTGAVQYGVYNEASNQNTPGTPATNGDLQYTRATVFAPGLTELPTTPAPGVTVVRPPTATNPGTPNNPVSPPGTTPDAINDPTTPGYVDPVSTSTSIGISGNTQTAYPPVGITKVTFNNQVNNTTALNDTVKLFPTDGAGNPIGTNNGDGSFTLSDGSIVRFLSSTGAPLPLVTGVDGKKYPTVTAPSTGSISYRTEISNFPISATDPVGTTVNVGASSGNKGPSAAVKADATTTDTILPPGLLFGDSNGGNPDGTLKGPGNVAQTVNPTTAAATDPITNAASTTDSTAVFPMIIKNTGEYADTYTLDVATISFPTTTGGTATVKVRYVDSTGTELAKITTGTDAGKYFTPPVGANTSLTVYAVVDVPSTAASTNGTTIGTNPDITFTQKATANYSGSAISDTNDQITIQTVGALTVNKYQDVNAVPVQTAAGQTGKTANPKDIINYAIVAKNVYNAPVKNVIIKDSNAVGSTNVYIYADFQSASMTMTGFAGTDAGYFSTDAGASWSLATPANFAAATVTVANGIWVYVNTDGVLGTNNAPTANDAMPATASIELDISVKVK